MRFPLLPKKPIVMVVFLWASLASSWSLGAQADERGQSQLRFPPVATSCKAVAFFADRTAAESLLGKEDLEPQSPLFRVLVKELEKLRAFSDFPQIDASELESPVHRQMGGRGNAGVIIANWRGKKVLVKVMSEETRTDANLVQEARWYAILNKVGLGAELYGLIRLPDGKIGMVTEFVEGVTFPLRSGETIPADFPLGRRHAAAIRAVGKRLRALGVAYAPDIQFRLTSDGRAVLIDPEYFSFSIPLHPPVDLPYDPVGNCEELARTLALAQSAARSRGQGPSNAPERPTTIYHPGATTTRPDVRIIIPGQQGRRESPTGAAQIIVPGN